MVSNLIYRKLKISDYQEFRKLFYSCFKRKVSFDFYKSRYFDNKKSFCYGAFLSEQLIANVGMVFTRINNPKKDSIYSRHSSMVLNKFRGQNIYSNLLEEIKKKILKNTRLVVMWPNKNNFANFGIRKKKLLLKNIFCIKL